DVEPGAAAEGLSNKDAEAPLGTAAGGEGEAEVFFEGVGAVAEGFDGGGVGAAPGPRQGLGGLFEGAERFGQARSRGGGDVVNGVAPEFLRGFDVAAGVGVGVAG